jgi:hypothetical protein
LGCSVPTASSRGVRSAGLLAAERLIAEAPAVAILVEARLLVTADTPLLRSGAAELGVGYEVLA